MPETPALLTSSFDRRMPLEHARRGRARPPSRSQTSQTSYSPPISSASARSRSSRRASSTQCQPRDASTRASASPIPLDAPVTTATGCTRGRVRRARRRAPAARRRPSRAARASPCSRACGFQSARRGPRRPASLERRSLACRRRTRRVSSFFVELATTSEARRRRARTRRLRQEPRQRGPVDDRELGALGTTCSAGCSSPIVSTFFVSW